MYMNHLNQNIFGGRIFLGGTNSGGGNFSAYENVSICNGYRVSDIFRIWEDRNLKVLLTKRSAGWYSLWRTCLAIFISVVLGIQQRFELACVNSVQEKC